MSPTTSVVLFSHLSVTAFYKTSQMVPWSWTDYKYEGLTVEIAANVLLAAFWQPWLPLP